jgi:hypothetical protein
MNMGSGLRVSETGGEGGKGFEGEHVLDRNPEQGGELQREFDRRRIIAPLEIADGLGIDPDLLGQVFPAETPLGSKDGYPVVNHF